jgi:mitochondrial fission protein ELM1
MNVLILSDGRAGHFNQSRAVCMALGRSVPVRITEVRCKLRAGVLRYLLRALLNTGGRRLPLSQWRRFHSGDELPPGPFDLIVSAGGHTACGNAWLAAQLRCRNLFCGDLRGLRPELFAGVITAFDPPAPHARYIRCTTPVPVDPAELEEKGAAWRAHTDCRETCWSLLTGGPGAGYEYTTADWERLAKALSAMSARHGVRWLVSTSRRTGAEGEAALLDGLDPALLAASIRAVRGGGDISYHEILGTAERHFVTEDSHMMITEAIASGRPVHTLQPAKFLTDAGNLHFLKLYEQNGWIVRQRIAELAATGLEHLPPPPPSPPAILADLAEKLAAWLKVTPAH